MTTVPPDHPVRSSLAEQDTLSKQELVAIAADESQGASARLHALRILLMIGSPETSFLALDLLSEESLLADHEALAELLNCPVAIWLPAARLCLSKSAPEVRWRVLSTLIRAERAAEIITNSDGQAFLTLAVEDEDWRIANLAVDLLVQCDSAEWAHLALHKASKSQDERIRVRVLDALGTGDDSTNGTAFLKGALNDPSRRVRIAAFTALARQSRLDEEALQKALQDPFPPLRRAALDALLASAHFMGATSLVSLAQTVVNPSQNLHQQ